MNKFDLLNNMYNLNLNYKQNNRVILKRRYNNMSILDNWEQWKDFLGDRLEMRRNKVCRNQRLMIWPIKLVII